MARAAVDMIVQMVHTSRMCKFEAYLAAHNITHAEMAARVGVSRAHLTKLANGTAYPSRSLMLRIAEATEGQVPVTAWFPQEAAE